MILLVCRRAQFGNIPRFLGFAGDLATRVRVLAYEDLFRWRIAPIGHYIFTDFDRLAVYERQVAEHVARCVQAAVPAARILNRPARVLERFALLRRLHAVGINSFDVIRLDEGRRPPRYPAFIRREDEFLDQQPPIVVDSDAAYDAAVEELERSGVPVRGFVAIGWCDARGADGMFRKYGTICIGERLVPIHLQINGDWVVKFSGSRLTAAHVAEELAFVQDRAHHDVLRRAFAIARIEYGRIDYGIVDGRIEIFEINTHPTMPGGGSNPARAVRSKIVVDALVEALRDLDQPLPKGEITFDLPDPVIHPLNADEPLMLRAMRRIRRAMVRGAR